MNKLSFPKITFLFLGVGGVSMFAITHVLTAMGHKVYGTDIRGNLGGSIEYIEESDNIPNDVDVVVYNTDIKETHPHMIEARKKEIPIVHRTTVFEWITKDRLKLVVTGGSGKTSTTFYLYQLLSMLNIDPFVFMGERTFENGLTYKFGRGPYVVELNEADLKYQKQTSDWLIVTNYGVDHIWSYKDENEWKNYWIDLINRAKYLVYCYDDITLREFNNIRNASSENKTSYSYGLTGGDLKITFIEESLQNIKFSFEIDGKNYNAIINLHGSFNVLNVCAAILLIYKVFNISIEEIIFYLPKLEHSKRRMEIVYQDKNRIIFDDQALTPLEVSVVLSSLKKYNKPIHILLDPFRGARVDYFFDQFCDLMKSYTFASPYEQFWSLENCIPIKSDDDFKEFLNKEGVICLLYKGFKWIPLLQEKYNLNAEDIN